jgi:uncharacterized metal-binding protein YceD (DUF177 family)
MFEFRITDIPEGDSHLELDFDSEQLQLMDYPHKNGHLKLDLKKTEHFIKADFSVEVVLQLVCDRSLDTFDYPVNTAYSITFKAEATEEKTDEHEAIRNIDYISNTINIEEDVRDSILLSIPIKKIHPRFLDESGNPVDYVSDTFGDVACDDEERIDPRWEALKKLKK